MESEILVMYLSWKKAKGVYPGNAGNFHGSASETVPRLRLLMHLLLSLLLSLSSTTTTNANGWIVSTLVNHGTSLHALNLTISKTILSSVT